MNQIHLFSFSLSSFSVFFHSNKLIQDLQLCGKSRKWDSPIERIDSQRPNEDKHFLRISRKRKLTHTIGRDLTYFQMNQEWVHTKNLTPNPLRETLLNKIKSSLLNSNSLSVSLTRSIFFLSSKMCLWMCDHCFLSLFLSLSFLTKESNETNCQSNSVKFRWGCCLAISYWDTHQREEKHTHTHTSLSFSHNPSKSSVFPHFSLQRKWTYKETTVTPTASQVTLYHFCWQGSPSIHLSLFLHSHPLVSLYKSDSADNPSLVLYLSLSHTHTHNLTLSFSLSLYFRSLSRFLSKRSERHTRAFGYF